MATPEPIKNVGISLPASLLARLDNEVAELRLSGQIVNRSQLIRHALIEVLRPEPAPRRRIRKQKE